jgi:hypothetical protein
VPSVSPPDDWFLSGGVYQKTADKTTPFHSLPKNHFLLTCTHWRTPCGIGSIPKNYLKETEHSNQELRHVQMETSGNPAPPALEIPPFPNTPYQHLNHWYNQHPRKENQ